MRRRSLFGVLAGAVAALFGPRPAPGYEPAPTLRDVRWPRFGPIKTVTHGATQYPLIEESTCMVEQDVLRLEYSTARGHFGTPRWNGFCSFGPVVPGTLRLYEDWTEYATDDGIGRVVCVTGAVVGFIDYARGLVWFEDTPPFDAFAADYHKQVGMRFIDKAGQVMTWTERMGG